MLDLLLQSFETFLDKILHLMQGVKFDIGLGLGVVVEALVNNVRVVGHSSAVPSQNLMRVSHV